MTAKFTAPRRLTFVLSTLALVIGLVCFLPGHGLHNASAQSNSTAGSYSYLWTEANGTAVVGVLVFDGASNITGSYTNATQQGGASGSLTGTYTSGTFSGNGIGTMNIVFDNGLAVTAAYVNYNGGMHIAFTSGLLGLSGTAMRQ